MKIEITETPRLTHERICYVFTAKIEGKEYEIGRHETWSKCATDEYNNENKHFNVAPHPEKIEIYDAIQNLFINKDFHRNTTQEGEVFEINLSDNPNLKNYKENKDMDYYIGTDENPNKNF